MKTQGEIEAAICDGISRFIPRAVSNEMFS